MRKHLIYFLFVFYVLSNLVSYGQNRTADSLEELLRGKIEDTSKIKVLNYLFLLYEFKDGEKSKNFLNEAFELAQKKDFKAGLSLTYTHRGFLAEDMGNYSEALKNYQESLKIYKITGITRGIANAYNNMGSVNYAQGNYPEALNNYLASLKLFESMNSQKDIAASYNNIGIVYFNQGNYAEALKNHEASLKIKEKIGDKPGIAYSYNNMGNVYTNQGKYLEALNSYLASLKIKEEASSGDKKGIASLYNNIGLIYFYEGNYEEALKNYDMSLKIKEAIDDQAGMATSFGNMGNVFSRQKKYDKAQEYLFKARDLAKKIGYKKYLRDAYGDLAKLDSTKGDFKGQFINYSLYIKYRDSLNNEVTKEKTIEQSMAYEFEKKELQAKGEQDKKDAIATEDKRKQRIITYSVSIGLLLVLLLAAFIFRGLRQNQKTNIIITRQKKEVENQKHLIEEKQKEIIDSIHYARRIQAALITPEKYIEKSLNKLTKV